MKNFTIALFAIMMIAGFAMADETATVNIDVDVLAHSTMTVTVPGGGSLLEYTMTGGADVESLGFNVYAEANYAGTAVSYGFVPTGPWIGLSYTDFTGVSDVVNTGVGGNNFPKDFVVTSTLDALEGTYLGVITVTLTQ